MAKILKPIFPNGIEYGDGVVCPQSPFSATLVLDFYDGVTEGFSRIAGTDSIIYFKRIWWDECQNNRLFDGLVFRGDELKKLDRKLCVFVERGLATASPMRRSADAEEPLPANLFDMVRGLSSAFRVNIFCVQITRELFILPMTE
jgi:hypothetical protein